VTRMTTVSDREAVAMRAATDISRHIARVRDERGTARLALSGGSTPARTYELLAQELADWTGVEIWFVDERCVDPDDEESNYRLARETLIEPAGIPSSRVHRMLGEMGPDAGADLYSVELSTHAQPDESGVPALDLCVLGIGPDGHVASLFPGATTLSAGENELCLGVSDSPKPPPERITLSLPVLRAAGRCLLIATGAGKRAAIAAMLGEPSESVPASMLRRERLAVIVDDEASPPD
jgi:6-phosphogluconolactonase